MHLHASGVPSVSSTCVAKYCSYLRKRSKVWDMVIRIGFHLLNIGRGAYMYDGVAGEGIMGMQYYASISRSGTPRNLPLSAFRNENLNSVEVALARAGRVSALQDRHSRLEKVAGLSSKSTKK